MSDNTLTEASGAESLAGIDLDEIYDIESAEVPLVNPNTGVPTGAFVTLAGPEHPDRRRRLMNIKKSVRASLAHRGRIDFDPEEDAAEQVDFLVSATLGWRGLTRGGKPLPFSADEARRLYSDPRAQWLVLQLQNAVNDRALFTKA